MPEASKSWFFGDHSHGFTGFRHHARMLTRRVGLKRGLFNGEVPVQRKAEWLESKYFCDKSLLLLSPPQPGLWLRKRLLPPEGGEQS
jgi:hypothetical protein